MSRAKPTPAPTTTNAYTNVPSVATNLTTLSPGPVTKNLPANNLFLERRLLDFDNPHFDFLTTIVPRPTPPNRSDQHEEIFSHILTPYDPDTFESS
jgi:hypothetical protein